MFEGSSVDVDGEEIGVDTGAVVRADASITLASAAGAEVLVLQGRPIGQPVAQYGPFVMNDDEGIEQAFADYRQSGFGGWPWPSDEPVHADGGGRFARRPDGTIEHRARARDPSPPPEQEPTPR